MVFHEVFAATVIILPVSIILATFNVPVIVSPDLCTAVFAVAAATLALLNAA